MERKIAKWVRAAFIPAAVGLALSAPVFSASAGDAASGQKATTSTSTHQQAYRGLRASQLIGKDVKSPQGKNLGKISDLIVDMNTSKVRYAILEFDPGVFSAEKLFAVPTSELKLGQGKDEIVYDMSRERLEKAGVEKGRWPGVVRDRDYLGGIDRTYGITQPSDNRRAFRAAELLGKDVNGRDGKEIGEIRDLVIDMNGQRVHYAVLAFDPSWVAPEKLFAFPLNAFTVTQGQDELALNVDKSRLQAMRSFDQGLWTAFTTPVFVTDIDRYLVTVAPMSANSTPRTQSTADAGASSSPQYSASMKRLQNAAQKLRESIQAMAQQPVGERRNKAIEEARQALYDTNQAMIQLPPELRSEPQPPAGRHAAIGTTASPSATGSTGQASPGSQVEYSRSMELLQKSAQKLRESIQAMAQQPQGPRRDQAIKEAHQALHDTNQAMTQLPPEIRTRK